MKHRRWWLRFRFRFIFHRLLAGCGIRNGGFLQDICPVHRYISNYEAAPPTKHFSVIDSILIHLQGGIRLQCILSRKSAQELPVAYQVESEEVASHTVVESGIADNEFPFFSGSHFGGAFEGLKSLFAELLVQNYQGRVVGKI